MNSYYLVRVMQLMGAGMFVILILAVGVVLTQPDDQDLELKHHCEMVHIYRESGGEYGWPDYNNRAHLCLQEKIND
jgi:hypothetical protein